MFHENGATLNGHVGSVFASPETAAATDAWPIREDLWADRSESSGVHPLTGEETFGPMTTETAQHDFGSFEHGAGYVPEFGATEFAAAEFGPSEFGPTEFGIGEYGGGEYSGGEYSGGEYGAEEFWAGEDGAGEYAPGEYAVGENSFGESPAGGYATAQQTWTEQAGQGWSEQPEHGWSENASPGGTSEVPDEFGGYEHTGVAPAGYTALEDVSWEDVSWESVHGAGESAYEEDTFEVAEAVGDEQPQVENVDREQHDLEWPAEVLTGEWAVGAESSASADTRFGMNEHLQPEQQLGYPSEFASGEHRDAEGLRTEYQPFEYQPFEHQPTEYQPTEYQPFEHQPTEYLQEDQSAVVPAGQHIVARHPMLASHRGTSPDLVVRWNAMPAGTRTVDVVVHLHGYSGAGAKMRVQDKATASGVDLPTGSSGAVGRTGPMLGLVPRGNFFGGQSGAGYNFPALVQPGAIDQLVASGLELLRQQTGVGAQRGRLILTGHSGGGAPLNAILRHTDPDEVHLFDGSYGDLSHVVAWARRRIARGDMSSALRVLFRPGSGTARQALAVAAAICPTVTASPNSAALHRRFRVEATSVAHNEIPKTFGGRLLADPGADLPGAVPQGCAHGGRPASGGTQPAPTGSTRPTGPQARPAAGGATVTATPDRIAGVVKVSPYTKDGTHALPGAAALAAQWRRLTGRAAGTFNARNTSFGTRSLHSEGRAIDCHGRVSVPAEAAQAEAYIRWLIANAVELQVSTIIWNRRIWSWPRRAQGWRNYMTKPQHNPHIDHFHVDLSWEGALHPSPLFAGGIIATANNGTPAPPAAPRNPTPAPPSSTQPPPGTPKGPAAPTTAKRSPAEFVRMFGPFARASQARTGVPGLVTLAQAAVESGWGAKAAGHNFFGIKAKATDPADTRQLWRTREVLSRPDVRSFPEVISVTRRPDGRYEYVVRDWFRVFPSPELAFIGHGQFLRRNKRYAPAFAVAADPYRFAAEVARAGYATDPRYTAVVHSVMRLLERHGWKP